MKCKHDWVKLSTPNSLFEIINKLYWCFECGCLKKVTVFLDSMRKPKVKYNYPKNRR